MAHSVAVPGAQPPRALRGFLVPLVCLTFGIAYGMAPVFTGNQNTYLLHGMASAGWGSLNQDWLAATADPFPVFSALVTTTATVLRPSALLVFYVLCVALYLWALWAIALDRATDLGDARVVGFLFLVFLIHSRPFASFSSDTSLLSSGVAGQYVLGPVLQPSMAGVFLLVSLRLYLHDRPFAAVACARSSAAVGANAKTSVE